MTTTELTRWRVISGEARTILQRLPDRSVQCVVTSPPYWGLRDYGVAGQIGLEATPAAYVAQLLGVFREVWRVLRDDATLWMVIGDSYTPDHAQRRLSMVGENYGLQQHTVGSRARDGRGPQGDLKAKDLVGIPWMVAFALRAEGWYLRSEIIWAKSACMPESVTDRPTKAHEQLFLLTKQPSYFYDAEAIREPSTPDMVRRAEAGHTRGPNGKLDTSRSDGLTLRGPQGMAIEAAGRNKRSVWTINPHAFSGMHFAVMPEALAEPCILAGTSAWGACPTCGAPWRRVVARETFREVQGERPMPKTPLPVVRAGWRDPANAPTVQTTGWAPTCTCEAGEPVPCVVLDPFAGAGTTGVVAVRQRRSFVGIELNPDYAAMARQRIGDVAPLYAVEVA